MAINASGAFTTPNFKGSTSVTTIPQKSNIVYVNGAKPYVIKEGDTLQMIASRQRSNTSVYIAKIKSLNGIRDDSALAYMVGQVIQLPNS